MVHRAGPSHRGGSFYRSGSFYRAGSFYRGGGARYRLHVDLLRVCSARCRRH
jgi:hypothetical protein